jgi:hypothetical protein
MTDRERLDLISSIARWYRDSVDFGRMLYEVGDPRPVGEFFNDLTWVYEAIAQGTKARLEAVFLAAADRGQYLVSWATPLPENHPVWAFIETYDEDK